MESVLITLVALPFLIGGYAYAGYPVLLRLVSRRRSTLGTTDLPPDWPFITITVPCYNEAPSIRATIEALLAIDYPPDQRQIIVISDASSDGTDEVVRSFQGRGVELLRLEKRRGKSAAENAAGAVARGTIIVNTDATIRILPGALKNLIAVFSDPSIGVASGRDVSVVSVSDPEAAAAATGESGYVGYEMNIRSLETKVGSIVGASGCFYGIRASLYDSGFPETLSRDFASALIAAENGFRAVSVNDAVCLVPATKSLQSEYKRKIRTMARGLQTLWFKRHLLNPLTHGAFAWMLFSHKLCRWLVYPALVIATVALVIEATQSRIWASVLLLTIAGAGIGVVGMRWSEDSPAPKIVRIAGFALASNLAGVLAWLQVLRNRRMATWEPTRR